MLQLIIASVQAILQVMTVVICGLIFAKAGYFPMDKQKWLSKLNLMYFTPCLLFSNVASIISFDKLLAYWPIPVFYYTYSLVFYAITQLATRLGGLPRQQRRFVLACVMFQNTNSLPLAIISSLAVSEAASLLFWHADDTPDEVAARGISYTLFFAIFGNLLRWSYGYRLLQTHNDDVVVTDDDDSSKINANNIYQGYHDTEQQQQWHAPSTSSSLDRHQAVNETSALLPKPPNSNNSSSSSSSNNAIMQRLTLRIQQIMTPPLYAALLALVVGLSPLQQVLYNPHSFLYPSFTKAIEMCGKAAVPIILSCLGAQLASMTGEATEEHGGHDDTATATTMTSCVTLAVVMRMLVAPLFVFPLVILFVQYGSAYSILATDPVFIVMMLVLGCTPTAINLIQIAQVNGMFEHEMLSMLFWSYGVVCVPLVTLVVFVALNVVDRLL
ncbi:auxin efflux carrier [Absidia repens]|uniref:Auxin efflux carrier n=1 Tax=Absidia repens TaxID=90262 RepID=A0A1X2I042_9FUNG|nr:auxin efflux carrier [Absidia repens]